MTSIEREKQKVAKVCAGPGLARLGGQALTILLTATAFAWMLRLLIARDPIRGAWTLQVMLAVGALLASCWGTVDRRRFWFSPIKQLKALVPQARRGQIPIDELSQVSGGIAPLIPMIQGLLRDLRQQKAAIAKLEAEIRQRVAKRTDALERTIDSLRHQATRDALTGLFNRRFLDQYLPQATQRCQQDRIELCLLMIDVDNFKPLNDTLGHAAGDELLKAIGQLIRSAVRGDDVAFRCGGDEFVVLLPGCSVEAGKSLAGRLTSLVDALVKTLRVAKPPRLSIGLSNLTSLQTPTAENLLAEADRDLYAIKAIRHAPDPRPTAAKAVATST